MKRENNFAKAEVNGTTMALFLLIAMSMFFVGMYLGVETAKYATQTVCVSMLEAHSD